MVLSRIGFGEPSYISKFGSKPLQEKYRYKPETEGSEKKDTYRNKTYKKKAVNVIASAALLAGAAFGIYKGKGPIINAIKKVGSGGVGQKLLKPFKAVGSFIGSAASGIGKTVAKPFKAVGSFIGGAASGIGKTVAKPFKAAGSFIGGLIHKGK